MEWNEISEISDGTGSFVVTLSCDDCALYDECTKVEKLMNSNFGKPCKLFDNSNYRWG